MESLSDASLSHAYSVLYWPIAVNGYIQTAISLVSLALSSLLFYIVLKWTPPEMEGRCVTILTQLLGCFFHSLIYTLAQPIPIFPHQVLIFSGVLRSVGSLCTAIIFILWCTNMCFMSVAALIGSFSHYLDTTDGLRQVNSLFEWFRHQPFPVRRVIISLIHSSFAVIVAVAMFLSVDYTRQAVPGSMAEVLTEEYSTVFLRGSSVSLLTLGGVFTFFVLSYCAGAVYLTRASQKQMEQIRSSVSPTTFEMMQRMGRLLFSFLLIPVIFFFVPTTIFIACHFLFPVLVSTDELLLLFTISNLALYALFPLPGYVLILVCFKQYRTAFFSFLRGSSSLFSRRLSRSASIAPQKTATRSDTT